MHVRKQLATVLRASIVLIGITVVIFGVISFLLFGVVGLAAWGDYRARDCPGAGGCDNAAISMWFAAFVSPVSLMLCIAIGRLTLRTFSRLQRSPD
jgi:uncharacterized membrane protein